MKRWTLLLLAFAVAFPLVLSAQKSKDKPREEPKHWLDTLALPGLKFRSIGPALTSGRISDIAVHPQRPEVWYVATASGGVWKTVNNGTTFEPIFDGQGSYSIGCVTLDPSNPNVVWVGTGENNNQRSVGYGDGVYKSEDGGKSWQHMGLKNSEHIGKIIVHPENSDIVFVAAIGPLWSSGGERGVYKTTDGGKTWEAVLTIDEHTGVTDLVMDPRDPDVLYAAAFQRRRHVFTYLGGGPGSTIYKTRDGGQTWQKANKGLPNVELGRIGLAISPADPEILYAIVEAAQGKSGFYRSTDRGASWEKRSSYSTSGNYYQEIVAHPTDPDIVFAMDTWLHWTTDGGKTFTQVNEQWKHVDNHCLYVDPQHPDHWIVGCDGGLYETWDGAQTWDFKANLPVTQFYKVAVDNSEPFYYVYGGTQDNFSLGGPSRTRNQHGIMNSDWFVTQGGDGFESAIDPDNPNIVYAQFQYGGLTRYDRASGESTGIQPKPREGEDAYRWNWDAPLLVSHHKSTRLYFAANKLFRSDDRGDTWEVISPDLTRQIDRNQLPVMGRIQSIDAVAKNRSTSPYGTIVAFDESPLDPNLLYVGTDDGLVQISEDGGKSWHRIEHFPGVPDTTYVNMLLASRHDPNRVYACFNNHKRGDFKPYVLRSDDRGRTWTSIAGNLPERGSAYSIAEDHEDPELLFVGTEFGCFFTPNGGERWKQLKAGLPTIAVRDIAIQRRENDLVLGTFGRGFYILDDYSPLRHLEPETLARDAEIFPIKDGLVYIEATPLGLRGKAFQGHSFYTAPNPPVGAVFTWYLRDEIKTLREQRREREKKLIEQGKDVPFPSYEAYAAEENEDEPFLLFLIRDADGNLIRQLKTKPSKGVNRIVWDGRYPSKQPVSLRPRPENIFGNPDQGILAMPGEYSVSLMQSVNGELTELVPERTFRLQSLGGITLPARDRAELLEFQRQAAELQRSFSGASRLFSDVENRLKHIRQALLAAEEPLPELYGELRRLEQELKDMRKKIWGDPVAQRLDQPTPYAPADRLGWLGFEMWNSTSTPTHTYRETLRIVEKEFRPQYERLKEIVETDLRQLEEKLEAAGAPYTPGRLRH